MSIHGLCYPLTVCRASSLSLKLQQSSLGRLRHSHVLRRNLEKGALVMDYWGVTLGVTIHTSSIFMSRSVVIWEPVIEVVRIDVIRDSILVQLGEQQRHVGLVVKGPAVDVPADVRRE